MIKNDGGLSRRRQIFYAKKWSAPNPIKSDIDKNQHIPPTIPLDETSDK